MNPKTDSMECGCTQDTYCDYDGPEAFSISHPRAKVVHVCCECKGAILPGDHYERIWGIWNGSMSTFKTCEVCARIRNDYGCCASYGHLRESIRDSLCVDYVTGEIFVEPFLRPWIKEI